MPYSLRKCFSIRCICRRARAAVKSPSAPTFPSYICHVDGIKGAHRVHTNADREACRKAREEMLVIQIGAARIWSDSVPRVARRRLLCNALTTTGLSFDLVKYRAACAPLGKRRNLSLKFDSMPTPCRRQRGGKFLLRSEETRHR